jgi:hypothetical protein
MRYTLTIAALLLLASCDNMSSNTHHVTDTAAGVQLIPHDNQDMPVDSTDTAAPANMPTVDPDTSKVQPK